MKRGLGSKLRRMINKITGRYLKLKAGHDARNKITESAFSIQFYTYGSILTVQDNATWRHEIPYWSVVDEPIEKKWCYNPVELIERIHFPIKAARFDEFEQQVKM